MVNKTTLLNAAQARILTEQSLTKSEIENIKTDYFARMSDKTNVITAIIEVARKGGSAVRVWIKYQDTYDELLAKGYTLTGGRVWENMPSETQGKWGSYNDKVEISW